MRKPTPPAPHTGAQLKSRREYLGRSVTACASALGLTVGQIESLEDDNGGLLSTAKRYAEHLGLRLHLKVGPRSTRDIASYAASAGVSLQTARAVIMLAHRLEDANPKVSHVESVLRAAGGELELR